MCYNVRVWMMVQNHMLVPNVGQININHHQTGARRARRSTMSRAGHYHSGLTVTNEGQRVHYPSSQVDRSETTIAQDF